jgi:hypothetical protein
VAISDIPASQAVNQSAFYTALMPNRGRTRFLRDTIRVFVWIGVVGCLFVAVNIFSEFHARHSWPIAPGEVTDAHVKAFYGGSSRQHYPMYYVEYGVRFAVPANECLTGTISADVLEHLPCWGTARTRDTGSALTANSWLMHHRLDPAVGILHDPNGPGVKIVGESLWLTYSWREISTMSGWMAFFLTCLNIIQRRLQYLETLPENYDESPPEPPRPNDLIDLKLS